MLEHCDPNLYDNVSGAEIINICRKCIKSEVDKILFSYWTSQCLRVGDLFFFILLIGAAYYLVIVIYFIVALCGTKKVLNYCMLEPKPCKGTAA